MDNWLKTVNTIQKMFVKCLVIFICVIPLYCGFLEAYESYRPTIPGNCSYPRMEHGRVRFKQRARLVKFLCLGGYELVGNKYATCRDGQWDVTLPVCVKPGCSPLPHLQNGMEIPLRKNAWVIFFCMPGYKLEGSSTIYCDGRRWNDTLPTCVDATTSPSLSCDFESFSLCGWMQDELHDFDWRRLNRKTPSSFLFTGPSYDHTYGEGGLGYYMYIESTSQKQNDTARLLSPIYEASVAKDACFAFYYHMFGKATGGLRIYQKPDSYPLQSLLELEAPKIKKYLLFEKWGNQGNAWYGAVSKLTYFADNFQIVIEGIRGSSFTSDIAVDDVAILHGANCTTFDETSPGTELVASCAGRCDADALVEACGCSTSCIDKGDCCADYVDMCLFSGTTTEVPPKTEKLIRTSPNIIKVTNRSSTTLVYSTTPTSRRTTASTVTTTKKMVTTSPPVTWTAKANTTKTLVTKIWTTPVKNATISKANATTPAITKLTTQNPKTSAKFSTSTKITTPMVTNGNVTSPFPRAPASKPFPPMKTRRASTTKSSSNNTTIIVVFTLLTVFVAGAVVVFTRSARGRVLVERLRRGNDGSSEVRYLTRHEDED